MQRTDRTLRIATIALASLIVFTVALIVAVLAIVTLTPNRADAAPRDRCTAQIIPHEDGTYSGGPVTWNGQRVADTWIITENGHGRLIKIGRYPSRLNADWPVKLGGVRCTFTVRQPAAR